MTSENTANEVQIRLDLPHPAEAEVEIVNDSAGRPISILVKPRFARSTGLANLLYLSATGRLGARNCGIIKMAGGTGRFSYVNQSNHTKPAYLDPNYTPPKPVGRKKKTETPTE